MNKHDALNILGLSAEADQDAIKAAFKAACKKYHPDVNPAGAEMMVLVNRANEALKDYKPGDATNFTASQYGDEVNEALKAVIHCDGLEIEIAGAWIWVSGYTRQYKDVLKAAGFLWAPQKKQWYFRPKGFKAYFARGKASMGEIRAKYGSERVKTRRAAEIES